MSSSLESSRASRKPEELSIRQTKAFVVCEEDWKITVAKLVEVSDSDSLI